jgi:WD40 repeat protein
MVKAKTLQVVWHNREPVYTLDFHPSGLLATGGGDKEVKLWKVTQAVPCCCTSAAHRLLLTVVACFFAAGARRGG